MKNIYHTGSCLCGSIAYEVDKIESQMSHCHCSMCRKFHGSAFSTFGEAKVGNFRWIKGEELLASYKANNGAVRRFCKVCGSSMTFSASGDTSKLIEFSLGTLDSKIDLHPDAHVYIKSKVAWFEVCDDLPQYKAGRSDTKET